MGAGKERGVYLSILWRALFRTPTHSYDVDERGFPGVLKAHERQLHLLFPEEALEPLDDPVYEAQHLGPPVKRNHDQQPLSSKI